MLWAIIIQIGTQKTFMFQLIEKITIHHIYQSPSDNRFTASFSLATGSLKGFQSSGSSLSSAAGGSVCGTGCSIGLHIDYEVRHWSVIQVHRSSILILQPIQQCNSTSDAAMVTKCRPDMDGIHGSFSPQHIWRPAFFARSCVRMKGLGWSQLATNSSVSVP